MIWSDFFGYCSNSTTDLQAMSREIEQRLQIPGLVTRVSQRIVAAGSGLSFLQKDWDAEVIVLFSGELLEKEAMCQEMSIPLNTPDPDVVLNTFLKKGDLCFESLKGVYSAAILEGSKALVYRDPIGARGLFYHIDNKGLTFSNRLPFVMANPLADEGLDEGSFHEYLRFLDICGPRTIFKNVFHLEPGSLLVYENGRCNIRELDLAKDQIFSAPHAIDEAADNLERLLREKIQERLDPVKTGIFLSGGIDSGIVAAIASDIAADKIEAFTVGFENKAFDEMHIAGQVAKHLNIKHRPLYFRQKDYFRIFDKVVSEMDQPYADPSSLPTFLKFEYCRDKAGAFLDGTGADGIMGDLPPRQKIFAARYAKYLPGTLRKMMVRLADKNKFVSNYRQIFDFDDPAELFIRWKGYKKEEIQQLCNRPVSFAETTFFKEFDKNKKLSPLALYGALLKVMSDDRIHQSTRPYELNLRFPFWDTQIKAYVRLFDESYKYDFENMKPKKVLRMIFGRYVPSRIWDFPKHGFNFPLAAFLHAYMDQIVHRYLTTPGELCEGMIDKKLIVKQVKRFNKGDNSVIFKLWLLIVFQAWSESRKKW